eukprot:316216_1
MADFDFYKVFRDQLDKEKQRIEQGKQSLESKCDKLTAQDLDALGRFSNDIITTFLSYLNVRDISHFSKVSLSAYYALQCCRKNLTLMDFSTVYTYPWDSTTLEIVQPWSGITMFIGNRKDNVVFYYHLLKSCPQLVYLRNVYIAINLVEGLQNESCVRPNIKEISRLVSTSCKTAIDLSDVFPSLEKLQYEGGHYYRPESEDLYGTLFSGLKHLSSFEFNSYSNNLEHGVINVIAAMPLVSDIRFTTVPFTSENCVDLAANLQPHVHTLHITLSLDECDIDSLLQLGQVCRNLKELSVSGVIQSDTVTESELDIQAISILTYPVYINLQVLKIRARINDFGPLSLIVFPNLRDLSVTMSKMHEYVDSIYDFHMPELRRLSILETQCGHHTATFLENSRFPR